MVRDRKDDPRGSQCREVSGCSALPARVPGLLARIGAVWTGPMIILKGPELASRYPEGFRRTAGDIDLLVDDADAAHAALRAAGFVPTGDPRLSVDIHHLQPLVWPEPPSPDRGASLGEVDRGARAAFDGGALALCRSGSTWAVSRPSRRRRMLSSWPSTPGRTAHSAVVRDLIDVAVLEGGGRLRRNRESGRPMGCVKVSGAPPTEWSKHCSRRVGVHWPCVSGLVISSRREARRSPRLTWSGGSARSGRCLRDALSTMRFVGSPTTCARCPGSTGARSCHAHVWPGNAGSSILASARAQRRDATPPELFLDRVERRRASTRDNGNRGSASGKESR